MGAQVEGTRKAFTMAAQAHIAFDKSTANVGETLPPRPEQPWPYVSGAFVFIWRSEAENDRRDR